MAGASLARTVMQRCDTLASYSEEPGRLTRPFATPSMRRAADAVAGWMRAAGMSVRRDNIGNLIGRYEAERAGAKTVLLGSHLDTAREAACRGLQEQASRICAQRQVTLDWREYQQSPAVRCDPGLSRALAQAIEAQGYRVTYLASGAGHDGVAISALTPIAMLFVRCQGGISHHPAESVSTADVAVAIEVLSRFLTRLPQDRETS